MDDFADHNRSLISPAGNAAALSPDNNVSLPHMTRALYVAGAGDVAVEMASGAHVTFPAVPGGTLLPCRVLRLLAKGTTATGIVGLW